MDDKPAEKIYYDLNGRRVMNPQRVYISRTTAKKSLSNNRLISDNIGSLTRNVIQEGIPKAI